MDNTEGIIQSRRKRRLMRLFNADKQIRNFIKYNVTVG